MQVEDVAKVCHAVNKALCESFGDHSQKLWEEAEGWQKESAITGVEWRLANPDASGSAQHDIWCAEKIEAGWTWGPHKDSTAKTHPCLVSFDSLPPEQKAKDALFVAVVESLRDKVAI